MDVEIFVVNILALEVEEKILVELLAKIRILVEYLNYVNIFLFKLVVKFLKYNNNNYIIKLKKIKNYFMTQFIAWG